MASDPQCFVFSCITSALLHKSLMSNCLKCFFFSFSPFVLEDLSFFVLCWNANTNEILVSLKYITSLAYSYRIVLLNLLLKKKKTIAYKDVI